MKRNRTVSKSSEPPNAKAGVFEEGVLSIYRGTEEPVRSVHEKPNNKMLYSCLRGFPVLTLRTLWVLIGQFEFFWPAMRPNLEICWGNLLNPSIKNCYEFIFYTA